MTDLSPGHVVWVQFDPTVGREQRGRRPAVVIASHGYLAAIPELVIVIPATTRDRGWAHHVQLTGSGLRLPKPTWAMTEQPRTISRARISGQAGNIEAECRRQIERWFDDFVYHSS